MQVLRENEGLISKRDRRGKDALTKAASTALDRLSTRDPNEKAIPMDSGNEDDDWDEALERSL